MGGGGAHFLSPVYECFCETEVGLSLRLLASFVLQVCEELCESLFLLLSLSVIVEF